MPLINMGGLLATATAQVTSLTTVNSVGTFSAGNPVVSMPSGTAAGDLLLGTGRYQGGSFSFPPSGFTALFASAIDGTVWAGYRIVQSGDTTFSNTGDGANFVTLFTTLRPNIPITEIIVTTAQHDGPTSGSAPDDVIVPQPASPAVVYAYLQAFDALSAGMSPTADYAVAVPATSNIRMDIKLFNAAPSAVTCSMANNVSNNIILAGALRAI
jgi:hypothetical protein